MTGVFVNDGQVSLRFGAEFQESDSSLFSIFPCVLLNEDGNCLWEMKEDF